MSDADTTMGLESQDQPKHDSPEPKPSSAAAAASYSLWPPTERTRKAVVDRLIETVSTPSPLSRRYGTLSADEAAEQARLIEQEAFAAATEVCSESGMMILQIYSKEISKRMLEVVKSKSAAASATENGAAESGGSSTVEDAGDVSKEEVKTEEST